MFQEGHVPAARMWLMAQLLRDPALALARPGRGTRAALRCDLAGPWS
jgi:hypothetical protein